MQKSSNCAACDDDATNGIFEIRDSFLCTQTFRNLTKNGREGKMRMMNEKMLSVYSVLC